MKKILFTAYSLDIGGIETALVTLLNYLADTKEYDITLALEEKRGIFLNDLSEDIKVIEYKISKSKIVPLRKFINMLKQINFKRKYKNKFDFAAAFATYSIPDCFMTLVASENTCIWGHMDYLAQYDGNKEEVKKFFKARNIDKFKNIILVSKKSRETFLEVFPELEDRTHAINNLIDYKKIINMSNEMGIELEVDKNATIFVNVGRHEEKQKRLSRIIKASKMLKDAKYNFRVLLVGEGPDTELYKGLVRKYKLEKEILFMNKRRNPYTFYKAANCVLLSSDYEGYPVVFIESMVMGKPIITTDIADTDEIRDKYGIIAEKNSKDLYLKMKKFIDEGFIIKEKFNPEEFNKNIINQVVKIINDDNKLIKVDNKKN